MKKTRSVTHTGGYKEFAYSDEDIRRQRSEDTESTWDFKLALDAHREKKKKRLKVLRWVFAIILILLLIYFFFF